MRNANSNGGRLYDWFLSEEDGGIYRERERERERVNRDLKFSLDLGLTYTVQLDLDLAVMGARSRP